MKSSEDSKLNDTMLYQLQHCIVISDYILTGDDYLDSEKIDTKIKDGKEKLQLLSLMSLKYLLDLNLLPLVLEYEIGKLILLLVSDILDDYVLT